MNHIVSTLRLFRQRPAVWELESVVDELTATNATIVVKNDSDAFLKTLLKSISGFMQHFSRQGNRSLEDQNAVDEALSALMDPKACKDRGFVSKLKRGIGVTLRQLSRATGIRADLEDRDKKHWIRAAPRQYLNAISNGYLFISDDMLALSHYSLKCCLLICLIQIQLPF